jgi:hypothetical protein
MSQLDTADYSFMSYELKQNQVLSAGLKTTGIKLMNDLLASLNKFGSSGLGNTNTQSVSVS